MYAVIEFLGNDEEPSREISIVPLIWLQKCDTKCYWPIRTNHMPFAEFVKRKTVFKKSWPIYKVSKVYLKTASYDEAEEKLSELLDSAITEQSEGMRSDCSGISTKSLVQKQIIMNNESTDSSDSGDNYPLKTKRRKINNKLLGSQVIFPACSSAPATPPQPPPPTETYSLENISLDLQLGNTLTPSSSKRSTPVSFSSIKSNKEPEYEKEIILRELAKISAHVEQHSIILNELLITNRKIRAENLIAPENCPTFPFKTLDEFKVFDKNLTTDENRGLYEYLVRRLAAVGGSGIPSLTRRMMKHILSDHVGIHYNWKGRNEEKEPFEKTNTMKLIYEAANLTFPQIEKNDKLIADTVKNWLKFSKARLNGGNKKSNN